MVSRRAVSEEAGTLFREDGGLPWIYPQGGCQFYQPTIALIYCIFIILLLSFRGLERRLYASPQERLANALELLHEMHAQDKAKILVLLRANDAPDPRLHLLTEAVERMPVVPTPQLSVVARMARPTRSLGLHLVYSRRFAPLVITFFLGYALLSTLFLVFGAMNPAPLVTSSMTTKFVQVALLVSCALSNPLLVLGVWFLRRSPLRAYHWFKRAILLSILLTQVFMFYTQQLGAFDELVINLIVLLALNALIRHKHHALQQEKLVPIPAR